MTSSLVKSISTVNSISGVAQSLDDVWTDFLKLHISPNTKRTYAAVREWLVVRAGKADEPIFIALDGRSHGKRLSGRSVARLVAGLAKEAGITKHLSPHRIRHSSITTFLDASGGDVRTAQRLSRHSRLDTLMIYDDNRQGLQGKASGVLADLV